MINGSSGCLVSLIFGVLVIWDETDKTDGIPVDGRRVESVGAVVVVTGLLVVGGRVSGIGLRVGGFLFRGFLVDAAEGRFVTIGLGRGVVFRAGFFVGKVVVTGGRVVSLAFDIVGRYVDDFVVVVGLRVVFRVVFLVVVVVLASVVLVTVVDGDVVVS